MLALPSHHLIFADEVGQAHLRLRFKAADGAIVNAMAFRAVGQKLGNALVAHRDQPMHVAGSLTLDRYQGMSACSCACTISRYRIRDRT